MTGELPVGTKTEIAARIREIARRFGVTELYVFGSAARDDLNPDSDIDMVYSCLQPRSFQDIQNLKQELTASLGRKVDLLNKETLLLNARSSEASRIFLNAIAEDLVRII